MGLLESSDLTVFFLGLAVLLAAARGMGEVARRLGQPSVVGEMLAGVLLGPTCLGAFSPQLLAWLYPETGPAAVALEAIVMLGVALLLLVAGFEIDLNQAWRHGPTAVGVALAGVGIPLLVGTSLAWLAPGWWAISADQPLMLACLAVGAALAVSALPVIAKILLDLTLFQTDLGLMMMVAATVTNLIAWMVVSVILGGTGGQTVGVTIFLTLAYVALVLTLGRRLVNRMLPWIQAHCSWPSGVLSFVLACGLVGAAITEAIGIHAIFGALLAGIALGESEHLSDHTRHIVHRFVEGVLAPVFIAAIGLKVNFLESFRLDLVLAVLVVGFSTKVLGCFLAARLAGLARAEAWAVGWTLNARGELGIIISLLAWQAGLIGQPLFVALVILAMASSATAGPLLRRFLQRERPVNLASLLDRGLCLVDEQAATPAELVRNLAHSTAGRCRLDIEATVDAVERREAAGSTSLGHGIAVPHARIADLKAPLVAVSLARRPLVNPEAAGEAPRLLFLVLTPEANYTDQVRILSAIAHLVKDPGARERLLESRSDVLELMAALRIGEILTRPHVRPRSRQQSDAVRQEARPALGTSGSEA